MKNKVLIGVSAVVTYIIYLVLIAVFIGTCSSCGGIVQNQEVAISVPHRVELGGTTSTLCTGYWIDDQRIATAGHCVGSLIPGDHDITVYWRNKKLKAQVLTAAYEYDNDHAVLRVEKPQNDVIAPPFCDTPDFPGLPVMAVCSVDSRVDPTALSRWTALGLISGANKGLVRVTAEIAPGCSGGPVYLLSPAGDVKCVLGATSRGNTITNHGLYTKVEYLEDQLRNPEKYSSLDYSEVKLDSLFDTEIDEDMTCNPILWE